MHVNAAVDLHGRPQVNPQGKVDCTLRVGRLQTLERFGLAPEVEPGVWTLSEKPRAGRRL